MITYPQISQMRPATENLTTYDGSYIIRQKIEPCYRIVCHGVVLGTWQVGSVLKNVMIGADCLVE